MELRRLELTDPRTYLSNLRPRTALADSLSRFPCTSMIGTGMLKQMPAAQTLWSRHHRPTLVLTYTRTQRLPD